MKKERLSIIDKGSHHASLGVANIGKTWYKKRLSCQVGIFAKFFENGKFAKMDNFCKIWRKWKVYQNRQFMQNLSKMAILPKPTIFAILSHFIKYSYSIT